MVDYPSTGSFGQTDSQWKEGKTQYEVMEDRRNKKRDFCNRLEQKRDAERDFLYQIECFVAIMDKDLQEPEIEELRRLWKSYSKKCIRATELLNDSRNELRKLEADLFNFKQRR